MAFNIIFEHDEGSGPSKTIEVFLDEIIKDIQVAEENFLKKSMNVMKRNVIRNLNHFKTETNKEDYKHMADDVQARIVKDQYGSKVARIRGGPKTGTKWHLVNDGTYRSDATHFMDFAITQTERDLEVIADEELKKRGF